MEKRNLYDKDRNVTNDIIYKGEEIPKDRYLLVVLIFIQNSDGKFLIQKRSIEKNGKYATTGGHPKYGEDSLTGVITEVQEELGIDISNENIELYFSERFDDERVFCDDYYLKLDIDLNDLVLQKEEVDSVYWLSSDEIFDLYKEGKFFLNHFDEFELLLNWLKNRNN